MRSFGSTCFLDNGHRVLLLYVNSKIVFFGRGTSRPDHSENTSLLSYTGSTVGIGTSPFWEDPAS